MPMLMVKELDLIEQFRETVLDEIRENQKADVELIDKSTLNYKGKDNEFRIDEDGVMKARSRSCVPDVTELKRNILEEGHHRELSDYDNVNELGANSEKTLLCSNNGL